MSYSTKLRWPRPTIYIIKIKLKWMHHHDHVNLHQFILFLFNQPTNLIIRKVALPIIPLSPPCRRVVIFSVQRGRLMSHSTQVYICINTHFYAYRWLKMIQVIVIWKMILIWLRRWKINWKMRWNVLYFIFMSMCYLSSFTFYRKKIHHY